METTTRNLRRRLTAAEKEEQVKKRKIDEENLEAEANSRKRAPLKPFIKYAGKIFYHTEIADIAMVCDKLLKKVSESEDLSVMGFDLEWPFNFQSGPGKTAVIQLSPDLKNCYIFHVSKMKNLPISLSELLMHSNVKLTGNNVKNDARKLARDFTGFDSDKLVEKCIDLGVLANSILPTTQRWSLEKLVNELLNLRINKNKKVRNSEWQKVPLSAAQQKYAAIDSYASLLLYITLKEKEAANNDKEDDQNMMNKYIKRKK